MVEINLYPWREEEARYQKQTARNIILGSAIVTMVGLWVVHTIIGLEWQALNEKTNNLKESISALQREKAQYPQILSHSIEPEKTIALNKILTILVQFSNQAICLNTIERIKNRLVLSGIAPSELELVRFLKQWRVSPYLSNVQIDRIHSSSEWPRVDFDIHAMLEAESKKG